MSADTPRWVRVGGGMESIPHRHGQGPADTDFPPPGGPWEPLILGGRLVGWADQAGLGWARRSAELGQQLANEQRAHLLGRLGHKLRSAVLALQESARHAAFGRSEVLEDVYEQAQEVGRRAAALEAVSVEPKDGARGVVLAVVLNLTLPGATRDLPANAVVLASEPVLVEAFTRVREWLAAEFVAVSAQPRHARAEVPIAGRGARPPLAGAGEGGPPGKAHRRHPHGGW